MNVPQQRHDIRRRTATASFPDAQAKHGCVQMGQHVIVQHAAGSLIEQLAFDQALALQGHQSARHLGAGLGVDQSFPAGAGDFDLLLGVEAPIAFFTQQ